MCYLSEHLLTLWGMTFLFCHTLVSCSITHGALADNTQSLDETITSFFLKLMSELEGTHNDHWVQPLSEWPMVGIKPTTQLLLAPCFDQELISGSLIYFSFLLLGFVINFNHGLWNALFPGKRRTIKKNDHSLCELFIKFKRSHLTFWSHNLLQISFPCLMIYLSLWKVC